MIGLVYHFCKVVVEYYHIPGLIYMEYLCQRDHQILKINILAIRRWNMVLHLWEEY